MGSQHRSPRALAIDTRVFFSKTFGQNEVGWKKESGRKVVTRKAEMTLSTPRSSLHARMKKTTTVHRREVSFPKYTRSIYLRCCYLKMRSDTLHTYLYKVVHKNDSVVLYGINVLILSSHITVPTYYTVPGNE
jgi:hypothetical protein